MYQIDMFEIVFMLDYLILKMFIWVTTFFKKIIEWISAGIRTGFPAIWNGQIYFFYFVLCIAANSGIVSTNDYKSKILIS